MGKELPAVNQQKFKIRAFGLKDFSFFFSILLMLNLANFISAQNNAALIPNLSPTEQVTFDIFVDGIPLDKNFEIISFFIEQKGNEPKFAKIDFHFHADISKLNILNRNLKIRLGYHNSNEQVFSGETRNFFMSEIAGALPVFSVDCEGEAVKFLPESTTYKPKIELVRGVSIPESELSKNNFGEVQGRITIRGINSLQPGDVISLGGFSPDFNGNHQVSKLMHEFHENKWITIIHLGYEF